MGRDGGREGRREDLPRLVCVMAKAKSRFRTFHRHVEPIRLVSTAFNSD